MTTEKQKTATRVYAVKQGDTVHLVESTNPGSAVFHVYGQAKIVTIPKQHELIAYIQAGVKVELAKVEQPNLPL